MTMIPQLLKSSDLFIIRKIDGKLISFFMNNIHKMIRIIRGIPPQSRQRPQPITKLQEEEEEERMIYFSGENRYLKPYKTV